MAAVSGPSVRQQFADTMLAVGQEDPSLVVVVGSWSRAMVANWVKRLPSPSTISTVRARPDSIAIAAMFMALTKPRHALPRS